MSMLGRMVTVGSATIAAVLVAYVTIVPGRLLATSRRQTTSNQQKSGGAVVCVGPDSVLRAGISGGGCPSGQTRLPLLTAGEPGSAPDDTWPSPPQIPQSNPVAELTRRVQNLEKSPLLEVVEKPATIPVPKGAPVKRDNAKLIFSVRPDSTRVYGPGNIPVAGIRATEDGGQFVARSADGALAAFVGASGSRNVGVLIEEGGVPRLDVGKQPAGNYALIVPSNIDGPIAGIGETRGKLGGTLVIGDEAGRMKAQMAVVDNKGTFAIHNASGAILLLKEATNGAGMLAINTASKAAVKMDVNDDRYGVVLAGPTLGFPLVPSSGLPGSYILGCAGGAGCRPY